MSLDIPQLRMNVTSTTIINEEVTNEMKRTFKVESLLALTNILESQLQLSR